jgi:hypothetical protein
VRSGCFRELCDIGCAAGTELFEEFVAAFGLRVRVSQFFLVWVSGRV